MKDFLWRLALKFAPTYKASKGEKCFLVELENRKMPRIFRAYPAWSPYVHFSARRLSPRGELVAYEINYLTIWDRDTGLKYGISSHEWDTERSAILVIGPKDEESPESFRAKEAYFAAHEGVPIVDKSSFHACRSQGCGVDVYWSEGKHASYPDNPSGHFSESFALPPFTSEAETYQLFNVGTVEDTHIFWVLSKSWGAGVGSVYEKLRDPLWDKESWERKKRTPYTEKDIKIFQEYQDLPVTGRLNEDTIKAIYNVDYRLIENKDRFSKKSFQVLRHSQLRGKDIDLVARQELSDGKIERIVRNDLHGRSLKKYLRE